MKQSAFFTISLLISLLLFSSSVFSRERRLALVIGNESYKEAPLDNPVNDASDMAAVLKKLGFKIIYRKNASKETMETAVSNFEKQLRKGGVGLFYYAGHGMQLDGRNYLIPINAGIETKSDVIYRTVDAEWILGKMEDAGNGLNIVILDACRNNPFDRGFRKRGPRVRGLAEMVAPTGAIVAYATAPGAFADDGGGRNGIYTRHLIKHMLTPGLAIERVLKNTRIDVARETGNTQIPWEHSSLMGDFYFAGKEKKSVPKPVIKNESLSERLGMKFVYIALGTFMMGSPSDEPNRDDDEKQHKVILTKGFYMQTTEVTVGQWRAFVRDTGYRTEAEKEGAAYVYKDDKWGYQKGYYWGNPGFSQTDSHPVTCVSWNDVQTFIKWLNHKENKTYRLPTEAEWEYACRAGTNTPFSFGKCLSADQANYDGNYPFSGCPKGKYRKKTVPVASFSANLWGLYDMHGNVWEWCQDWHGSYHTGFVTDPIGRVKGSNRVLRGGSWFSKAKHCRSTNRDGNRIDDRNSVNGFRLVLSIGQ